MDNIRDPYLRDEIDYLLHTERRHETYKLDVLAVVCSVELEAMRREEENTAVQSRLLVLSEENYGSRSTLLPKENLDDLFGTDYYYRQDYARPRGGTSWARSTKDTWFPTLLDNHGSAGNRVKEESIYLPPIFDFLNGGSDPYESMEESPVEQPYTAQDHYQDIPSKYEEQA